VLLGRTTIYSVVCCVLLTSAALSHAQQPGTTATADGAQRIVALDPRWTVSFTTPQSAPAGFDQQMAYVPLKGGELLAIDLNEGRVVWTVDLTTSFTPATGDGLVFVAGDALVIALDQRSGQTVWRAPLGASISGPLHWDGGWVLASTEPGDLVALNLEDGQVLWRSPLGSPLAVRPTASDDRLYVALRDGRLAALDGESGTPVWTAPLQQDVTGMIALEDQLLVGTRGNALHSVSLDRGRIAWSQRVGADVIGAPAADEDRIYFVAFDNVLRALHRRTGNLVWRRNLPSRPSGGPLRVDDVVLVPFSTNNINAYRATTGEPSFTIQAIGEIGSAPFLRDSARATAPRLIAMSREGALQGFAPRFEQAPVPLAELPGARVGS
jgi:outer membrane protein assembly factor BamB